MYKGRQNGYHAESYAQILGRKVLGEKTHKINAMETKSWSKIVVELLVEKQNKNYHILRCE